MLLKGIVSFKFKVDRLQMIVVAKNLSVLQLFISRMPKMCAILQLVSAPLNPMSSYARANLCITNEKTKGKFP